MQLHFFGPAAIAGLTPSDKFIYTPYFDVSAYDVIGIQGQVYAIDAATTLTVTPQHTNDPTQDDLWQSMAAPFLFTLTAGVLFGGATILRGKQNSGGFFTEPLMSYIRLKLEQTGGSGTYLLSGQASVT